MFKRILSIILMTIILFCLLTTSVYSNTGYFIKNGEYDLDGDIKWNIQIGDNQTNNIITQNIAGKGVIKKVDYIEMKPGYILIEDNVDLFTNNDAIKNLEFISTIKLCSSEHNNSQIISYQLLPDPGHRIIFMQNFLAKNNFDYSLEHYSKVIKGEIKRFIYINDNNNESYLKDILAIQGNSIIKETLESVDIINISLFNTWKDLF